MAKKKTVKAETTIETTTKNTTTTAPVAPVVAAVAVAEPVAEPAPVATVAPIVQNPSTVCVALNRALGLKFRMPDGRIVEIAGNGQSIRGQSMGVLLTGAYGLTTIDAKDWAYIKKTYGGQKIFKNGLIFATGSENDSKVEAHNRESLRNGWEPIDPTKTTSQANK